MISSQSFSKVLVFAIFDETNAKHANQSICELQRTMNYSEQFTLFKLLTLHKKKQLYHIKTVRKYSRNHQHNVSRDYHRAHQVRKTNQMLYIIVKFAESLLLTQHGKQ